MKYRNRVRFGRVYFHFLFFAYFLSMSLTVFSLLFRFAPPGGREWIISVRDYVNNLFSALGSSDPREVRFEL